MHIRHVMIVLLAAALQLGCGGEESAAERESPPAVEDTVFGDTVSTLDKARAVEATVLEQKEALDRAINQSEGQ
jgi:hypothetical protein